MNIEEAEMWLAAYDVAKERMMYFAIGDDDAVGQVRLMLMAAYVEGVRNAKDDSESPA